MSNLNEPERLETLLALAVAFGQDTFGCELETEPERSTVEPALTALRVLSALDGDDRQMLERRAEWYAKLAPEKQQRWVARTLGRARHKHAQLDEHVHPSHIIAALNEESPRIQALILQHLPPQLAETCASALEASASVNGSEWIGEKSLPVSASIASIKEGQLLSDDASRNDSDELTSEPLSPEIVELVRETFLSHFVAAGELHNTRPLDFLSGIELARLLRLVSIRETALACRGIDRVEAVASFLRRFAAEDARAIATHIAMLTEVEPQRVAFAEQLVHEALSLAPEPGAMMSLIGMQLLAVTLTQQGQAHLDYTAQKLPLEAAHVLREMAAACCNQYDRAMTRLITGEIEALATNVRRASAHATETNSSSPLFISTRPAEESAT